jgi:STE24 endopeptidase
MENVMKLFRYFVLFIFVTCLSYAALAQTKEPSSPPVLNIPAAAQAGPNFDVKTATDAWLASVPPEKKARSDAYFEGGYWLQLWDFLISAAILLWMLQSRFSARIRDWAERITQRRNLQSLLYFLPFAFVSTVLQFPMTVYEGYFREHKYALLNQTFGPGSLSSSFLLSSDSSLVQSP